MAGHIFVMQGDVTHLRCDARLVPVYTEHLPRAETNWLREPETDLRHKAPAPPQGWPAAMRTWLLGSADEQSPALWITQVGLDDAARGLAWAMESVREYLQRAFAHALRAGHRPSGRAVPLLAMHLVASGADNAAHSLGDIVKQLLETVRAFADAHDADVVIVVREARQYAALQTARLRGKGYWNALPPSLVPVADARAEEARRGALCVLAGAGLSRNAGLPDWAGLLSALAVRVEIPAPERAHILAETDPLRKATALAEVYRACGMSFGDAVAARCAAQRIALGHGLLVNLPVGEYVTLRAVLTRVWDGNQHG